MFYVSPEKQIRGWKDGLKKIWITEPYKCYALFLMKNIHPDYLPVSVNVI